MVEAWHGLAPFDNGRDEFPYQIVAKYRRRLAVGRVARAACRCEEFGRHVDGCDILAGAAQQQLIGTVQLVDGGLLRAVDLGPFVAKSIQLIPLGERRAFPDAYAAAGKFAQYRRPVVDI